MSGRTRWQRDGKTVIGHRKTDRRQSPARPLKDRLQDTALAGDKTDQSKRVRMAFVLPKSLEPFVSQGSLADGAIEVLARGFVRISSWSAEQCFMRARTFFKDVAAGRPGFTVTAILVQVERPQERYSRRLSIVSGAVVVTAGGDNLIEPVIFEAA